MDCLKLIDEGKCHADCCGIFSFSLEFWIKYSKFSQVEVMGISSIEQAVTYVATNDGFCAFLNRTTSRCAIYANRPSVCCQMGERDDLFLQCPCFKPDGSIRTRAESRRFKREVSKRIANVSRRIHEQFKKEI